MCSVISTVYTLMCSVRSICSVYTLYKESDIITHIKINPLKWGGHVICMEEQRATRRVLVAVIEVRRQRGRAKLRWEDGVMEDDMMEDGVMEDARKLGERNWRKARRSSNLSPHPWFCNFTQTPSASQTSSDASSKHFKMTPKENKSDETLHVHRKHHCKTQCKTL